MTKIWSSIKALWRRLVPIPPNLPISMPPPCRFPFSYVSCVYPQCRHKKIKYAFIFPPFLDKLYAHVTPCISYLLFYILFNIHKSREESMSSQYTDLKLSTSILKQIPNLLLLHPHRLQCVFWFFKVDFLLHNHNTIFTHDQISNDVLVPTSSVYNQIPLIISKMHFYNTFICIYIRTQSRSLHCIWLSYQLSILI